MVYTVKSLTPLERFNNQLQLWNTVETRKQTITNNYFDFYKGVYNPTQSKFDEYLDEKRIEAKFAAEVRQTEKQDDIEEKRTALNLDKHALE